MTGLGPSPFPPPWASVHGVDRRSPFPFAERELAPGISMRLRWVPPGRYPMGSPNDEKGRQEDEVLHWVTLSRGFWLGEAPCTQAEWEAVMGKNPSRFKDHAVPRRARRPVEMVNWEDCEGFCARLNERYPGMGARLPTEAEREYACRAGTASAYNDGSECTEPEGRDLALRELGWFAGNSGGRTHDVKGLRPNAWGLYDMHGNVLEWCSDWHAVHSEEEQRDPLGPAEGRTRSIRGGSWNSSARNCRSALRDSNFPVVRYSALGFRLLAG